MKAWRKRAVQQALRRDIEEATGRPFMGRLGHIVKASNAPALKVCAPSTLLQSLMLKAGVWPVTKGITP